jgi:5-(carboxyamino)imidazole ribonucleotide synthase
MQGSLEPVMLQPSALRPDGQPMTLGVLGGGQLGRMFVHAAQTLGFRTAVLDPDPDLSLIHI